VKVFRVLILTERATDWHPLNSKIYLDVSDAQRAVEYHERNSRFFRWNDQYKIQAAEVTDDLFSDVQSS